MSILEFSSHELRIAHGLTLMTPSLRGWEVFPTPGALTHIRITWAISPTALHVPGVILGPLCAYGVLSILYREVRDKKMKASKKKMVEEELKSNLQGGRERAEGESPRRCVGFFLKNKDVMCKVDCSQPCLVLLSAYVGARERGLACEASFVCKCVLENPKYHVYISLLSAISCFLMYRKRGLGCEAYFVCRFVLEK